MNRENGYQLSLIALGLLVTALFGAFFYRELFPEYKIYQNIYIELESFRSSYTGESPPPFKKEVKQIVLERADKGPPTIDRCTSCHVALQFSHFSPTKIATDINGNVVFDETGKPVLEENDEYVWAKLDQKITDLEAAGKMGEVEKWKALKSVEVGEHRYDVTKVLQMHPLMGRETRPFEYHPITEYGCTSCHNGNGRGLVTDRAHGPVIDGQYEEEDMGPEPQFLEEDEENDPKFASVFNHKPGHRLLFQTSPLYVGALIQAKCVQCHQSSSDIFKDAKRDTQNVTKRREELSKAIEGAYINEKGAVEAWRMLDRDLREGGVSLVKERAKMRANDYTLPENLLIAAKVQEQFLQRISSAEVLKKEIDAHLLEALGSESLAQKFLSEKNIESFLEKNSGIGSLFVKKKAVIENSKAMAQLGDVKRSIAAAVGNHSQLSSIESEIDELLADYNHGEELFLSQACYACHRISGKFRGGVGPELTYAGELYPWYLKESIVWPQGNLKTSTMPNFHLDHEEIEPLLAYLLSQKGQTRAMSDIAYKTAIMDWEAGKKLPWEEPINPANLQDTKYAMSVFATEGCASCHRLQGFHSNVGFEAEKKGGFNAVFQERLWFRNLFPERVEGSEIVETLEAYGAEIDQKIATDVRQNSFIEELEQDYPELVEAFYSNFRYASRAKNHEYRHDPEKLKAWKERVHHVLMLFVQEYGLGRQVGPKLNWSGIYRSDEWLIEHFRKPSRHIAYSIMPVLPFDDSKFYALTYMLDKLAKENRDAIRGIWEERGFNPELAYELMCAQCHGEFLHGNGPIAKWIYPIPKNLRNADFLRNYTRENIIGSLVHGVKGTPMPPWGEVATDKLEPNTVPVMTQNEIEQMVDWLFASLLGGTVIRDDADVPKWQYNPDDILEELNKEKNVLPKKEEEKLSLEFSKLNFWEQDLLIALANQKQDRTSANEIFDIKPSTLPGPEPYDYYIKKKYYTEENIEAGKTFFQMNCTACHGTEADGMGYRSGSMYDAKPRMLNNLHWIDSRDDLRLIRSLKYGVPGTSMTPWGDLTSSLQRLQLVIYIRSLSSNQEKRDALFNALYEVFDYADQVFDRARIRMYEKVNVLKTSLNEVKEKRSSGLREVQIGGVGDIVSLYQEELTLSQNIQKYEDGDQLLVNLKELVAKEGRLYQTLGITLLAKRLDQPIFGQFLEMVVIDNGGYKVSAEGQLEAAFSADKENEIKAIEGEILQSLGLQLEKLKEQAIVLQGKLPSQEIREERIQLKEQRTGLEKTRNSLIGGFAEARRLRNEQQTIYNTYRKMVAQ